jgi:hypothetical protein
MIFKNIDIQGADYRVLAGAEKTLKNTLVIVL